MFGCPIITHEPLIRIYSSFSCGTQENQENVLEPGECSPPSLEILNEVGLLTPVGTLGARKIVLFRSTSLKLEALNRILYVDFKTVSIFKIQFQTSLFNP